MSTPKPLLGHTGQRFEWRGNFDTKDIVKAAGFRWDAAAKRWWTDDVSKAKSLKAYASERALAIIQAAAFAIDTSTATCVSELPASVRDSHLEKHLDEYSNLDGDQLMPFQKAGIIAGIAYLIRGKGVYLGDEMGLGKSVQALLMTRLSSQHTKTVIICPKAVTISWQREIEKWVGARSSVFPTQLHEEYTIVPWSQVAQFLKNLKGYEFDHLIVDECHYGKTNTAKRTKAMYGHWIKQDGEFKHIKGITDHVQHKPICLTGTPMPNRYIEAHTALKATGAGFAQKRDDYVRRYCYNHNDYSPTGYDDKGSINGEELYREMRGSTLIRRTQAEVISDIPPLRQQPVFLKPIGKDIKKLLAEEAEMYPPEQRQELLEQVKGGHSVDFELMSIVRHEMGLAKVESVVDHIIDMVANIPDEEGIVVFAHHKDVIEQLSLLLNIGGITAEHAHGENSTEERQDIVDKFAAGKFKVFVASISACGTGLNGMQTCSHTCLFAEFPWTPGEIAQAIGRLKRIGQTSSVLAQYLVIEKSLDAYIIETVLAKVITQFIALDKSQGEGEENETY